MVACCARLLRFHFTCIGILVHLMDKEDGYVQFVFDLVKEVYFQEKHSLPT